MEIILEAGRSDRNYWHDLWRYRELLQVLAWRDVAVRYKQTLIGIAWAFIRPLLTMVVFSLVFGRLAGLPSEGSAPYSLMVFAGMLPWMIFSSVLADATNSLIGSSNLITRVYFPRIIIPVATVGVALVDFLISLALLFGMMLWFRFVPGWTLLLLPCFVVLCMVASLGPALWIASINVKYRDFRYVVPFMVQLGLYVSPVGFSSTVVPERWRMIYSLNPMVSVIDGFRWSLLGGAVPMDWQRFGVAVVVIAGLLWWGIAQFRRVERTFADLI